VQKVGDTTPRRAYPLSILDLATVSGRQTVRESLEATVVLAQLAEHAGYNRVWYAEHHNMASIASSATSVLIAHVAANTEHIRLGAGGIMLPNHSPLVIAEQFGTLAELHPGRIDLGLGRAPGSDQPTQRALRRDPTAAEYFPQDVVELQGYLSESTRVPGVEATPGKGTNVPLYILGSSLFGASVAAVLGLPFAFASHFAPDALEQAVALYRERFEASEQLEHPYVIAGVNVVVAESTAEAHDHLLYAQRRRVARFLGRREELSDEQADALLDSPAGRRVLGMMEYTAVGDPPAVRRYLDDFARHAGADELIVTLMSPGLDNRLRAATLLAEVAELSAA
jgi:luciferase family oxidoreductase group 1